MTDSSAMLAATYTQGGRFEVQEVPRPRIERDELLLRVRGAAICGTDLKIVKSGHRKMRDGQRIVLGHEFVGTVEEVGSEVVGYQPGQRVGVAPNAGCGHCDACTRAMANYCPHFSAFGIDRDGAQAPFVRIPARFIAQGNVIVLPDSISDRDAALLEPLSCVVNSITVSRVSPGDTVLIYGAGPMGMLHVMLCRLAGAGRLIMVDPIARRLERARQLGCELTLNPTTDDVPARLKSATEGQGVDVAITACAVPAVQAQAVDALANFGRACLFGGLAKPAAPVPLDTNAIHYKNLLVTGCTGGSIHDYRVALKLVAGGRLDLGPIVSDCFSLSQLADAYDKAMSGADGKVVLLAE